MKNIEKPESKGEMPLFPFNLGNFVVIVVSLLTLTTAYFISFANLSFTLKTIVFAGVICTYLVFCIVFYLLQNRLKAGIVEEGNSGKQIFPAETEEKLLCLDETNTYFANSLRNADLFRLISNRINEIIPFAACLLIFNDENTGKLKIVQASGENSKFFLKNDLNENFGIVQKTIQSGCAQSDEKHFLETEIFQEEALKSFKAAAAFPLKRFDETVFGAIEIFFIEENNFNVKNLDLLDEIGKRVSPLFFKSLTFEKNLENSLVDPVTKLPNERAFYLILENQIAESQRFRGDRPLTVLCADIQQFHEINKKYGFVVGDRILNLAAKLIKGQLRQMDFLARSKGDEFLAVLPTASEEITKLIIGRIEKSFSLNSFEIVEKQEISVKLNFGSATFMTDGETASELLKKAELKKQNAKSPNKSGVVLFTGEFVR